MDGSLRNNYYSKFLPFKSLLSGLAAKISLKMRKILFYFMLKALFVLEIFAFFVLAFW